MKTEVLIDAPLSRLCQALCMWSMQQLLASDIATADANRLSGFADSLSEVLKQNFDAYRAGALSTSSKWPAQDRAVKRWATLGMALQQVVSRHARELGAADDLAKLVGPLPMDQVFQLPRRPEPMF